MKKLILAVSVLAFLSGCATQTYIVNDGGDLQAEYDETQHFYVWGIGQEQMVDAVEVCDSESQISQTQTERTFVNVLLGTLTLGLYYPLQARVFCKD
ncbi:MAG: lipoprotein bor [Pseudomonadota bacterium]|nr:lipoprotein bor [Pseudomonadota bacterium]